MPFSLFLDLFPSHGYHPLLFRALGVFPDESPFTRITTLQYHAYEVARQLGVRHYLR